MTERTRVVCVDDDPAVTDVAASFLRKRLADPEVTTTTEPSTVIAAVEDGTIDCVVSDYEMPGTDGLELLAAVRRRAPDLPFLLFTGEGDETVASEAVSRGVTDYLRKQGPEGYELLANRVEHAVAEWRAKRDVERAREKTARLHDTALALREADEPAAVCELAADAAAEVLEFGSCGVYLAEDGEFRPAAVVDFPADHERLAIDEGLVGRAYLTGESNLTDDVREHPRAAPLRDSFRSSLTVPVGDHGVFQAMSGTVGAFGRRDLELAELLGAHVGAALDRIENERGRRRANEQLETVLETTTAHIYIKDAEGRYELVNDRFAERLGLTREEIVGRTDAEIQPPEVAEEIRRNDRRAIEEGEPIEVEEAADWDDERRVYYSVKAPICGDDGEPEGVCGVSSDITALKRREEALQQQTEQLDEFVSVVSHDLRNPLTVAKGNAELLDEDNEQVAHLQTALDRMESIVEELLALARSGRQVGDTEPVDLAAVAREAWSTVETGDGTLTIDVDRQVEADRGRLRQLFENLFRNSVEHGSTGSRPEADNGRESDALASQPDSHGESRDAVEHGSTGSRPEADDAVEHGSTGSQNAPIGDGAGAAVNVCVEGTADGFAVVDDGPGIPAEIRTQLCSEDRTLVGTDDGFGLAIVERIAQAHDWTPRIADCEAGARFEFEL